jgi:membrane protein implicated in regulation of membrane protease activity
MATSSDSEEKTTHTTLPLDPVATVTETYPEHSDSLKMIEQLEILSDRVKEKKQSYLVEKAYQDQAKEAYKQAQIKTNKMFLWLSVVCITTAVLLTAATLLVLFVPPVAALILPLFAAIGTWSPLLLLITPIPSLSMLMASLVARRDRNEIQTNLNKSTDKSEKLDQTINTLNKEVRDASEKLDHAINTLEKENQDISKKLNQIMNTLKKEVWDVLRQLDTDTLYKLLEKIPVSLDQSINTLNKENPHVLGPLTQALDALEKGAQCISGLSDNQAINTLKKKESLGISLWLSKNYVINTKKKFQDVSKQLCLVTTRVKKDKAAMLGLATETSCQASSSSDEGRQAQKPIRPSHKVNSCLFTQSNRNKETKNQGGVQARKVCNKVDFKL